MSPCVFWGENILKIILNFKKCSKGLMRKACCKSEEKVRRHKVMLTLIVFGLSEQRRPKPEETGLYSQPGSSWTFLL